MPLSDLVLSERRGPVVWLTLNRPEALNALNGELLSSFGARLGEAAADPGARALVVTGAGRAFAAGADIAEMRKMTPAEGRSLSQLGHAAFGVLEALEIPTIAAVDGFALGGGCELACACDWIYVTERAKLGQPEVGLGLIPGFGGTSRLARKVAPGWVRELVLSGEMIDAELALRIGLANRSFADAEALQAAAQKVGETVAAKGPVAVAVAKRLLVEGADSDARVAHALEQEAFGGIFATEDRAEGMDAFLAKRDPEFVGR
ncbi:MAG: hypothetical protein GY723_17415 [bacterium]|nr:hypothetical protein [bacterium]MCP5069108.1 hypothetical protein [bacterium]